MFNCGGSGESERDGCLFYQIREGAMLGVAWWQAWEGLIFSFSSLACCPLPVCDLVKIPQFCHSQ